jgi:hypothetical protein
MEPTTRMRLKSAADGELFEGRVLTLSLSRILAFSGGPIDMPDWPDKNLHTNLVKAKEAGLAGIIGSGTQWEGLLIDLMIEMFGERWYGSGSIEAKITKSIYVGQTVQAKALFRERQSSPDGERIILDVWCENGEGDKVLVGTASALLD